jgi:hypothetical protein
MKADLFVEAAFDGVASSQRTDAMPAFSDPAHDEAPTSIVASSTRLTARDMRRHCASSSMKCRVPLRVSE